LRKEFEIELDDDDDPNDILLCIGVKVVYHNLNPIKANT